MHDQVRIIDTQVNGVSSLRVRSANPEKKHKAKMHYVQKRRKPRKSYKAFNNRLALYRDLYPTRGAAHSTTIASDPEQQDNAFRQTLRRTIKLHMALNLSREDRLAATLGIETPGNAAYVRAAKGYPDYSAKR